MLKGGVKSICSRVTKTAGLIIKTILPSLSLRDKHYKSPFQSPLELNLSPVGNITSSIPNINLSYTVTISQRVLIEEKIQNSPSPHTDLTMYLRNAAKAAVGVSYLLLIIAYQPVKSCNCPSLTDEQPFCLDEDLPVVKLTVLEVTNTDSSSSDFFQYKVRIEEVFKSNNGLTAQTEMDLKTPRISELCALQLSSETRYLISVSVDDGILSANACSWMKEWVSEEEDVVQALLAEIPPNCEEREYYD